MKKKTRQIEMAQASYIDRLVRLNLNSTSSDSKSYSKGVRKAIIDKHGENYRVNEACVRVKSLGWSRKASIFRHLLRNDHVGHDYATYFGVRKILIEKTIGILKSSSIPFWIRTAMCPKGVEVIASPSGPGEITGHSDRGYPKVNYITVAWCLMKASNELFLFDPHWRFSDIQDIPEKFFSPQDV